LIGPAPRCATPPRATGQRSARPSSYLPEPQRELTAPAPPAGTIEIVTRASALDYSDSWSGFKLTPERLTMILRQADWGAPLQLFDMYESTLPHPQTALPQLVGVLVEVVDVQETR
jgi:hypothetical protein